TVRLFRLCLVAHLRIVTYLTPFPTVVRGSHIRYWKRLSACYHCLLAMLEEDPTLTPRDIIVMVADIDSLQSVYSGCVW
ncbi:hypothetical protein CPT11_28185, partial [Klebsiella pneumoniae]